MLLCQFVKLRAVNPIELGDVFFQLGLQLGQLLSLCQILVKARRNIEMLSPAIIQCLYRFCQRFEIALVGLQFSLLLFLVNQLLLEAVLPDKRVTVIKAWPLNKCAACHKAVRQDGIVMITQFLAPFDTHQIAEQLIHHGLGHRIFAPQFLRKRSGPGRLFQLQSFRGVDQGLAPNFAAEFRSLELMVNCFCLLVVVRGDDNCKLACKGDFNGGSPAFIGNFTNFSQMTGGQIRTTREQAAVECVKQASGKWQLANLERGDFVS